MQISRLSDSIVKCQFEGCEENALFLRRAGSGASVGISLRASCEKHINEFTGLMKDERGAIRLPPGKATLPFVRKAAAS